MSKSKWTDEPTYKPMCCGELSTWICHSPTLHYFYCYKCKDEVDPVKGGKSSYDTKGYATGDNFSNAESIEAYLWNGVQLDSYGNPIK